MLATSTLTRPVVVEQIIVCKNCRRAIYMADGAWYHVLYNFRHCDTEFEYSGDKRLAEPKPQ
jgi:hypothetical protein